MAGSDIVKITEEQLFDYMFCPAMYHIKYKMHIGIQEHITPAKLLNQAKKFFLVNLLNGQVTTLIKLQKKWDAICTANQDIIDSKKNIEGWSKLVNFARWAEEHRIIVADMNATYNINIQNVILTGNVDTILVDKNKRLELLYVNFGNKEYEQYEIDSRIKYTIDSVATKLLFNAYPKGIKIYYPKVNKEFFTFRTDADYLKLETTIYNIGNAIRHNCFYPRESVMCPTCTAKKYCKYWHVPINSITNE